MLIKEQLLLGILHNPFDPLLQIRARDGAALNDGPFVCFDRI